MKYRKFGKLDWKISALGFGTMRLPWIGSGYKDMGNIDEIEAIKMMHHAFDHGVNFVDTGIGYHAGNSEIVVGKALKDGYREMVKLATKLPHQAIKKYEDCDRVLNYQLDKLQTDHIDFYLLQDLNKTTWKKLRELNVIEWAEKTIADGRIGHIGFSFHDDFKTFKEIVDAYDKWAFCEIQYNYMDLEFEAGRKGLQYAAEKGLAVVIMEPARGGRLSKEPPSYVKNLFDNAAIQRTPTEWAFQWLWHHPEVSVVLSGMSTMQHVVENLESADRSGFHHLSTEDLAVIDNVREEYLRLSPTDCTGCRYCMPCPNGVDIQTTLDNYNAAIMYESDTIPRFRYRQLPREQWADHCEECLECEEKCPKEVNIPESLKKAHDWLRPKE